MQCVPRSVCPAIVMARMMDLKLKSHGKQRRLKSLWSPNGG